jgi:hypothetical protein
VGVIPLILGLWQSHPNSGTHIRHKALKALRMMAVDNIENKVHFGTVITVFVFYFAAIWIPACHLHVCACPFREQKVAA